MYTFSIIMIVIASILLILAVLVQSPKSGMAANFGAANQTMGVRQTTDFLEKFTWAMVAAIVFFSLLSVTAMPKEVVSTEANTELSAIEEGINGTNPNVESEVEGEAADLNVTAEANAEGEAAEATETTEAVVETTEATETVQE